MNRWLILDDNIVDRMKLSEAVRENGDEVVTVATVAQARQQLRDHPFDICLFDFYFDKDHKITAANFIAELREWMPARPIIIISNANEPKHIRPCIMAGADVFLAKQSNVLDLSTALHVAAVSAKLRREMHLHSTARQNESNELYLTKRTAVLVDHALTQFTENLIIHGQSRTGKTILAKNIATEFQKRHANRFTVENTLYIDCAVQNDLELEKIIFGSYSEENSWQPNIFERCKNGIVIFDNVERMPAVIQREITKTLERGYHKTKGRLDIPVSSVKFIVTYSRDSEAKVSRHFLSKIASQTIALPTVSELISEMDPLVNFLVKREIKSRKFSPVSLGSDFCDAITFYVKTERLVGNFASLLNIIHEAILVAAQDNRQILFGRDVPRHGPIPQNTKSVANENVDMERMISSLTRMLREGTDYRGAKDLVRDIMLASAKAKVGNNLSEIAHVLGLSRAALYKLGLKAEAT